MGAIFAGCVTGASLQKQTGNVDLVGSECPDESIKPSKHSRLPSNSVYIGIKPAIRMPRQGTGLAPQEAGDPSGKSLHTLLYN